MTEVSPLLPLVDDHHRNGIKGDDENKPLFIQASNRNIVNNQGLTTGDNGEAAFIQNEEDQTIVIDLTEDKFNLSRTPADFDQEWKQIRQREEEQVMSGSNGVMAVRPASNVRPPSHLSTASQISTTSIDVHASDEDGQYLLHVLNGKGEIVEQSTIYAKSDHTEREEIVEKIGLVPKDSGNEEGEGEEEAEDDEEDDERNHSNSPSTERFVGNVAEENETSSEMEVEKLLMRDEDQVENQQPDTSSKAVSPPVSLKRPKQLNLIRSHKSTEHILAATNANSTSSSNTSLSQQQQPRSKSLSRRDLPLSLFGGAGTQSLAEASPTLTTFKFKSTSGLYSLRYGDGQRSLDRRQSARRTLQTKKSQSSDFLDRMDISQTSERSRRARTRAKMNKIEKKLYLGNMEAATDVILLESHGITHIVTLDSVPLPRKISSFLPKIKNLHLQVTDLPDEDLLSHVTQAIDFINEGLHGEGSVLVHCFRGKSRSAAVILAFLMQKHRYTLEKAIKKVRAKRECINPHNGFLAQLKLFESMDYQLDPSNVQFKMFKLHLAAERMRKAKILFRDSLDNVLDDDPGAASSDILLLSSAGSVANKGQYSQVYKCKRCRRTLATSHNLLPHVRKEIPSWLDAKWSLPSEEVLEGASDLGLDLCSQSVFINPLRWMQVEIKQNLSGRIYCPNCQTKVGHYSWVKGADCQGCKVSVTPAFQLEVTEIIFKTRNKFLHNTGREPVVV